jgi:hypothetical protein
MSFGVAKRAVKDWINKNQIHKGTQISKGTDIKTLYQNIKRSVEARQRPIKVDSRTIYRTLSSNWTPLQTGVDG